MTIFPAVVWRRCSTLDVNLFLDRSSDFRIFCSITGYFHTFSRRARFFLGWWSKLIWISCRRSLLTLWHCIVLKIVRKSHFKSSEAFPLRNCSSARCQQQLGWAIFPGHKSARWSMRWPGRPAGGRVRISVFAAPSSCIHLYLSPALFDAIRAESVARQTAMRCTRLYLFALLCSITGLVRWVLCLDWSFLSFPFVISLLVRFFVDKS